MSRNTVEARPREGGASTSATCARCGAAFECGAAAGLDRCWCAELPALRAPDPDAGCYCPRCLSEIVAAGDYRT